MRRALRGIASARHELRYLHSTLAACMRNPYRPCGKSRQSDSIAACGALEFDMTHISGFERSQLLLLPEAIDDYVVADNPVRFIDAFVDGLDLAAAGFKRVTPKVTGRPGYARGDLLKLYIYGYLNRVRSSRRLEAECHRNIEVIWLLRTLKPEFKPSPASGATIEPPSAPCSAGSRCCAGNSIFSGASCWRWMARASRRTTTRTATLRRTRWRNSSRRWTSVWTNICGGRAGGGERKPRQN